jgi:tetratricopeptide (TPR) repeat protein
MPPPEHPDQRPGHDLDVVARGILDQAIKELSDARLSESTRALAETVSRGLKGRDDDGDVINDVERLNSEIAEIGAILQRCVTVLLDAENQAAHRSVGSAVWWNARIRPVVRAFSSGQLDRGLRLLTTIWVEDLARNDWTSCARVLGLPALPTEAGQMVEQMRMVTDALAQERYAAALDPLDDLLDTRRPNVARMDQGAAVRLGVLRTRILSREFSDREMTRQSALATTERAGRSNWRPLALAGLAEAQLAMDEVEAARESVEAARANIDKATGTDWQHTDILVADGLVHEQNGFWALADQAYDLAVERDPTATDAVLLRPVPARLLVRAAISPAVDVRRSVDLLDRALELGIDGVGDNPERDVHLARAEQLIRLADDQDQRGNADEAQGHREAAARSLFEAGHGYQSSGLLPQALTLFRRACVLAPDVAEFHWAYADGLRLDAWRVDNTVDLETLKRAREQLLWGLELREPEDTEAWVLVTHALIAERLSDGDHDPALLVERALLKDPSYTAGYGFLAGILRRQGFVQEAFEVSGDGREYAGASDTLYFNVHLNLLLDLGKHEAALDLIEYQALRQPDADMVANRADVLLQMHRPQDALSELSGQEPTDSVRLVRGHCLFAIGELDASRVEFWSLWRDTRLGPAADIAGWAAYRAGRLEEAIRLYRDRRQQALASTPYTRDLGQMLLVAGQVAEGTSLLEEGIAACPYVAELRLLADAYFDYVRKATAGTGHGLEVAEVLARLSRRIEQRCRELLASRRPPEAVAALLGSARLALHSGRPLDALAVYGKLAGSDEVPEALQAAIRAGESGREAGDRLFTQEDHKGARRHWSAVERGIRRVSGAAAADLLRSMECRRMLAGLVDGSLDAFTTWLADVIDDEGLEQALDDAAGTLAYDPASLWALRDGLLDLREPAGIRADVRQLMASLADRLPLSLAYRLHLDEANTLGSSFLFINPLELRFGPGVEHLSHSSELRAATAELQDRIEGETGIRIPWVYAVAGPRLPDNQVQVRAYGGWAGTRDLSGPEETWIVQVMDELEKRVRGYLFRLVGVDEVTLWLEGWDLGDGQRPAWDPADPRADRLRLARVLRMLLREYVSVQDRTTIVDAVRSPAAWDRRSTSATLYTLLDVRRNLGREALGVGGETVVVPLPVELEEQVAAGVPSNRPVWELPRQRAHRLLADLRAWLRAQPVPPDAIRVADGWVRPFVWRLLAAEEPAVRIVSDEELRSVSDEELP